ncbi:MAG: sulfurtransferase complex subunit TusB [Nitrososphaerota archaeon]|nr:sulfurtransferase complex subunit TusB [Nitrososphaerota archaeon]
MTVFLVGEDSLNVALSYSSPDGRVVLLEDAVYAAVKGNVNGNVYVLGDDVERRGLKSKIPSTVRIITYTDLVKMMETEKVVNFL